MSKTNESSMMDIPEKYRNRHPEWIDFILQDLDKPWDFSPHMDIKQNLFGVYVIYNPNTLEFYIGSTNNIHYRLAKHRSMLFSKTHYNVKLQESFYKTYYLQATYFICEDRDSAYDLEQELLDANLNNSFLLNVSIDSRKPRRGLKFSEQTIERMRSSYTEERRLISSENIKKVHKVLHTPEALEIQRQRMIGNKFGVGQVVTPERREFLRKLNLGRVRTEETKQKISDTKKEAYAKGAIRPRATPIMINGIRYVSSNEACKQLEIHSGTIWHRVNSEKEKYVNWQYCK